MEATAAAAAAAAAAATLSGSTATAAVTLQTIVELQRDGLEEVVRRYSLISRRHKQHPNLVQLHYSQIESPFAELVVQECRGLLLDESDNWYARFPLI